MRTRKIINQGMVHSFCYSADRNLMVPEKSTIRFAASGANEPFVGKKNGVTHIPPLLRPEVSSSAFLSFSRKQTGVVCGFFK